MNLQLLYVSVATEAMNDSELGQIETTSLIYNALNSITGLLCYDGARFTQLLEGTEIEVERLFQKIQVDHRHTKLNVLYRKPTPYKSYGEWLMRCVRLGVDGDGMREMELLLTPTLPDEIAAALRQFARAAGHTAEQKVSLAVEQAAEGRIVL